jgi:hypothetical protein
MSDEEAFVQTFHVPAKQTRYRLFLASRKRRGEFFDRLNRHLDCDPAFAFRVPGQQRKHDGIELLLCKRGAPDTCHMISSLRKWDGPDLPVGEAI